MMGCVPSPFAAHEFTRDAGFSVKLSRPLSSLSDEEMEEARNFLSRLWQIDRRIRDKSALCEHYRGMANRAFGRAESARLAGSSYGLLEDMAQDMGCIEQALTQELEQLELLQAVGRKAVDACMDTRCRTLLELRYFRGYTWNQIAVCLQCDALAVSLLHREAMEGVYEFLHEGRQRSAG